MSKHQYLISKYHWKSRESFIELSAISAFSVLGVGSKTKTRNWRKIFYNMFIASYTSLVLKEEATSTIFHFKKTKIKRKKCEKDFPLHINIKSKCLNIGI